MAQCCCLVWANEGGANKVNMRLATATESTFRILIPPIKAGAAGIWPLNLPRVISYGRALDLIKAKNPTSAAAKRDAEGFDYGR
jgi:hypothetical protein